MRQRGRIEKRRQLASRYFERWSDNHTLRLPARGDAGHSWHIFAPLLPLERLHITRIEFIEAMKEHGIGVGVHYPALHPFTAYAGFEYRQGMFPNAERVGRETVTLPLFPGMERNDVDTVVDTVTDVLQRASK